MGHALRVRIIFDRVSFLVYFLKYLLFPHNLESIFFLNRVSTLVEFAKNLWFITRWANFSIVYHFWSIFLGSYVQSYVGINLIEYLVRSNSLNVCFVAHHTMISFFNLGSFLIQYGGFFLSTNGIICGWVFDSLINYHLIVTRAGKNRYSTLSQ